MPRRLSSLRGRATLGRLHVRFFFFLSLGLGSLLLSPTLGQVVVLFPNAPCENPTEKPSCPRICEHEDPN